MWSDGRTVGSRKARKEKIRFDAASADSVFLRSRGTLQFSRQRLFNMPHERLLNRQTVVAVLKRGLRRLIDANHWNQPG